MHEVQDTLEADATVIVAALFVVEDANELAAFQHQLAETHHLGHPPQADRLEQIGGLLWKGTEAVYQPGFVGLQSLLIGHLIELTIQGNALGDVRDVVVGQQQGEVRLEHRLLDVMLARIGLFLGELGELFILQFVDGLLEDFLVHLESDVRDESTLLATEQVARPADVEVTHGDVHAASEFAELLHGLKAFARLGRQGMEWGRQQVAECTLVGPAHPAAELVQVAQAEGVGLVDEDGVGVGDVDAALDDGGRHQHVVRTLDEVGHDPLELLPVHLAMADAHPGVRHEAVDHAGHVPDVGHPVVHEVRLTATGQLVSNGIPDQRLVEGADLGLHRIPIGWRRRNDAEVAGPHEGELQRPWDGRRGQGQRVHGRPQRLQLVLDRHPELLLLVDDEQAEVLPFDPLAHDGVRADQDVNLPSLERLDRLGHLLASLEAVDVIHLHRELLEPPRKAAEMLHREDGRRHEHRHLLAVRGRLEGRANGDLRLAEAHIATDEAVHGHLLLHVLLHRLRRRQLIRGVLVHEAGFQLGLEVGVRRVREAA